MTKYYNLALASILILFTALAFANAITKAPWCDEGLFADPALNLAINGHLGSNIQEPTGHPYVRYFRDLDRYTFWSVPFYFVTLASWFHLVNFSLISMRSLSILAGVALILSWHYILTTILPDRKAILWSTSLISFDYAFIIAASNGRPDCLTAALGVAGLAFYLLLRHRTPLMALAGAFALAWAAVFTHPLGLIHVANLGLVVFWFDRRPFRVPHLAVAVFPALLYALAWAAYIAEAPDVFLQQFTGHTGYRVGGIFSPLEAIITDVRGRYINAFWTIQSGITRLKVLVLASYLLGLLGATFHPSIRRTPGVSLLISLLAIDFAALAVLDTQKYPHYFIHVTPLFNALLGIVLWFLWTATRVTKVVPIVLTFAVISLQLGGIVLRATRNDYVNNYLPILRFVRTHVERGALIMCGSQFIFDLKDDYEIVDDARLGYYSGKRPKLIIMDPVWNLVSTDREPEIQAHREKLSRDYRRVVQIGEYTIDVLEPEPRSAGQGL